MAVTKFVPDITRRNSQVSQVVRSPSPMDLSRISGAASSSLANRLRATGSTPGEAQRFANIAAEAAARRRVTTSTTTPVNTAPGSSAPVSTLPAGDEEVVSPEVATETPVEAAVEPTPYSVYDDPTYQQALAQAQSAFNLDRAAALANMQYEQRPIQRQLEERIPAAEAERRRLAGNFARRGMAGGRYGALTRAEAEVNAREIGLRTGLREQIAELTRQFTANFGAEGTDWLGTRRGYEAQQAAIQAALQNRLAGLTTVG